jgi:predicted ATPase/class 3 adenylate cyclase
MNKDFPSGTVTFLFSDMEGSTKLAQHYAASWEALRQQHDSMLRGAIEAQNGYVFRTVGDAFCAAFETADEALRAAIDAQMALHAQAGEGPRLLVRMGLHTGQAEIQSDGDYQGYLTLARVQRVMSAAHGGQVLLSNATAELVRSSLPEGGSLLDQKEHRLKGLPGPERLWQAAVPGLPRDFPPLETLSDTPHNLPAQLTSFVGRGQEIARVRQALAQNRLVTLTGPGGIGKTRLSLEVTGGLVREFRHGAWFVELAHVTDAALVAGTIAQVFHLQEISGRRIADILKDYLRDQETLLVLDNFEQVIEAAMLVKELLLAAPRVKILVTSRITLRVSGEQEYRMPLLPLPVGEGPISVEQAAQWDSVQLFVERARSARSDFALTPGNVQAVAETCQRLDGLPLAIELAAARVRLLSPQMMLQQMDERRLKFLVSPARDLPQRQRTLWDAIAWSYDLLSPAEQSLFRQLAVFMGGASLEAIQSVCQGGDRPDLLDELESLLDQNLVRQAEQDGEARFTMLETIRDFADEMLVASGEAAGMQARHLAYFHDLARRAEPELVGPDELSWITHLADEHDNLRAAVQWGLKNDPQKTVELLANLGLFWSRAGQNEEVIGWLRMVLSGPFLVPAGSLSPALQNLRGRGLMILGILTFQQEYAGAPATLRDAVLQLRGTGNTNDLAFALAFCGFLGDLQAAQESVDLARTTGNKWTLSSSLIWQSQSLRVAGGDLQLAQQSAAEGAELARQIGSIWAEARSVFSQGQLAVVLGEWEAARAHLWESMDLFTRSQDRYHANMARSELAHLERRQGEQDAALELYREAILVWQDLGLQAAMAQQLVCIAMIAAARGSHEQATRLLGAAQRLGDPAGSPSAQNDPQEQARTLETLRRELGTPRFESLLAAGQALTVQEAIACAFVLP